LKLKPPSLGTAWIFLCIAFALHVIDEATSDFLSVYNPTVQSIREKLPFLPLPCFTFGLWLGCLIAILIILAALTPLAFKNNHWIRKLAVFLGIVMIFNGIGHTVGSLYFGRMMPGVYSSPLLLIAAIFLIISVSRNK
jgi:hypothetical protein